MFARIHDNLPRTHGFEPLEIVGKIPEDLHGTLYRCGPGVYERFGVRVKHAFEADGVVSAVRLHGSTRPPEGAARVIESAGYREEERAGRRLYGSGANPLRRVLNGVRRNIKNSANTSAWVWQNDLYGLVEVARPSRLDPDTLALIGETDLGGVVGSRFSAHPHRAASLGTSFNFGLRYGRETAIDLYELPDRGKPRRLGSVPLPWPSLVHDFALTERHAVFMICPAKLMVWRALLGLSGIANLFAWDSALGSEIIVVPLADPTRAKRTRVDSFWVWHFVNAFERGDEIVLDLCRYSDFSTFSAVGSGSEANDLPVYTRAHIDPRTAKLTTQARLDGAAEFPRVHPRVEGSEHRVCFLRHDFGAGSDTRHGISCFEVEAGRVDRWEPSRLTHLSEPVPVPRRDGEDERDVWLLVLCFDEQRDRSYLAVLDGRDVAAGPVAECWFDHPIPISYHGAFLERPR